MKRFPSYEEMEEILQERQRQFFLRWKDCGIDDGSIIRVFDRNMMEKQSAKPGLKSNLTGQQFLFPVDK